MIRTFLNPVLSLIQSWIVQGAECSDHMKWKDFISEQVTNYEEKDTKLALET